MSTVPWLLLAAFLGLNPLVLFALWKKDSVRAGLRLRTFAFFFEAKNEKPHHRVSRSM